MGTLACFVLFEIGAAVSPNIWTRVIMRYACDDATSAPRSCS